MFAAVVCFRGKREGGFETKPAFYLKPCFRLCLMARFGFAEVKKGGSFSFWERNIKRTAASITRINAAAENGGDMWESNPPGRLFTVCTGFEDRGTHRHPSASKENSPLVYSIPSKDEIRNLIKAVFFEES